MIAYLDSSVVLRWLLGQPGRLAEWDRIETGVASELVGTECLRTLDRLRLAGQLGEERVDGLVMATHDESLARAARACGLPVVSA